MLHRSHPLHKVQAGFTLVELVVIMALTGIITTTFYVFFNDSLSQYLALQKDGSEFTDIAYQSQRIGNVMRGIVDIVSESSTDITCYAYFSPNDDYTSLIHYYKSADGKKLIADVTPMTANPPIGSLITTKKQTYTIISDFYQAPGVNTFVYLDETGAVLNAPIVDEHTIKGVQVTLASKGAHNSNQTMVLQVSLRNRKTNL